MIAWIDARLAAIEPLLGLTGVPPERFGLALLMVAGVTITAPVAWRVTAWLARWSLTVRGVTRAETLVTTLHDLVRWTWVLVGLWGAKIALGPHLNDHVAQASVDVLRFGGVLAVGRWMIALAAPAQAWVQDQHDHRDGTYLWLFAPFVPNMLRLLGGGAIIAEAAEVFLGVSPLGLAGVVGGASVAFGLLFNETARELMAAGILYHDEICTVGDVILLRRDDEYAFVDRIGLRSTLLRRVSDNTHRRVPNTSLIAGDIINVSRSRTQTATVRAALLSADAVDAVCREIVAELDRVGHLVPGSIVARLAAIDGSDRILLVTWTAAPDVDPLDGRHAAQVAVLRAFEALALDLIQVTVLRTGEDARQVPQRGPRVA